MLYIMHGNVQKEYDLVKQSKLERKYVFWATAVLVLLAALRWVIPGSDCDSYVGEYQRMSEMSFNEVVEERDISYVYYLLSKIFSLTRLPYHFWFGFVEFLYVSAFLRIANKFSLDKVLCLFLFYTIGLFSFSFQGMKQILAMALIWHGFMDIYEKKFWRSAFWAFLAFFCHKTSMVFLVAYILPFIGKFRKFYQLVIVFLSTVLVFGYTSVLNQLTDFMGDEHYLTYLNNGEEYNATQFIFYFILWCISFFAKKQKNESGEMRVVAGLAAITVFSQLLAFHVATAFRLSLYFLPFLTIFISNQLKNKKDLQYLIFLFGAIWLLYSGRNSLYKFFWQ
jgi:hypothetical protein